MYRLVGQAIHSTLDFILLQASTCASSSAFVELSHYPDSEMQHFGLSQTRLHCQVSHRFRELPWLAVLRTYLSACMLARFSANTATNGTLETTAAHACTLPPSTTIHQFPAFQQTTGPCDVTRGCKLPLRCAAGKGTRHRIRGQLALPVPRPDFLSLIFQFALKECAESVALALWLVATRARAAGRGMACVAGGALCTCKAGSAHGWGHRRAIWGSSEVMLLGT